MRLLADIEATAQAVYDNAYHHKLRGRVWRALEGTKYDERHDKHQPLGLSFSNPFPWGNLEEGDQRHVLFASHDEEMLGHIAEDLQSDPELNIGEMSFHVDDLRMVNPDVGEPGSSGTIESGTGVVCRIPEGKRDEYGIEAESEHATFWQPEHTLEPFKDLIRQNLEYKHDLFQPEYETSPNDLDGELFDEYELIKTYALPVTVTSGVTQTYIVSKWKFGYTVRNDAHRKLLNFALDSGIGERNGLGFGFINITEGGSHD